MGVTVTQVLNFTNEADEHIHTVPKEHRCSALQHLNGLKRSLKIIETTMIQFKLYGIGTVVDLHENDHDIGEYMEHAALMLTVKHLKELSALMQPQMKVKKTVLNRIHKYYSLLFPKRTEDHIQTMEYIKASQKTGNKLLQDLLRLKSTNELTFDFEQVDYNDLVLLWYDKTLSDKDIQELFDVERTSAVTTKRKNLYISNTRIGLDRMIAVLG